MNVAWFRDNVVVLIVWTIFIICLCMFMIFMYPNPIFNTDKSMYVKEETAIPKEECKIQPLDIKVMLPDNYIKEEVQPVVYNITINNYSNTSKSKTSKVAPKEVLLDTKDMQIVIKK